MTLSSYNISSYEERKKILKDRKARPVDFALLEIKQAEHLLRDTDKMLGSQPTGELEAIHTQLHGIVELLHSVDGDAANTVKKMFEHAESAADDGTRQGAETLRSLAAASKQLDAQLVEASLVLVEKAIAEYNKINIAALPSEDSHEPKQFVKFAGVHLKEAQSILSNIDRDKTAEIQLG